MKQSHKMIGIVIDMIFDSLFNLFCCIQQLLESLVFVIITVEIMIILTIRILDPSFSSFLKVSMSLYSCNYRSIKLIFDYIFSNKIIFKQCEQVLINRKQPLDCLFTIITYILKVRKILT